MEFVTICLLVVLSVVKAKEFGLDFVEKGGHYTEKVIIDKTNRIVETDVPQHAGVEASKYLNDFKMGLSIMKLDRLRKCYASDLPADASTPEEVELGMKKNHNKFPENKYQIENHNILPVAELEPSSLSKAIKDFCGSYPVVKVIQSSVKTMEQLAKASVKDSSSGRSKRRTVTEFIACDENSRFVIQRCNPDDLTITCQFVASKTCVYKIGCKPTPSGAWNCPGVHSFTIVHCCDYDCKK